jgi:hypothetical protein
VCDTVCFYSVMQASVYRLRERGVKLPRPAVRGRAAPADQGAGLRESPDFQGSAARRKGALALPSLEGAKVRRITANGIVISGTEIVPRRRGVKAAADFWPQTWWCIVPTLAMAAEVTGEYEDLMQPRSATGF